MKANTPTFTVLEVCRYVLIIFWFAGCDTPKKVDPETASYVLERLTYSTYKPPGVQNTTFYNYIKTYTYNSQTKQLEVIKTYIDYVDKLRNITFSSTRDSTLFRYDNAGFLLEESQYSKSIYYTPEINIYNSSSTIHYMYKDGRLVEQSGCCTYEYDGSGNLLNNSDKMYHYVSGKLVSYLDNGILYRNETDKDGFIITSKSDDENVRQTIGSDIIRKYTYTNNQRASMMVYWGSQLKSKTEYEYDTNPYAISIFQTYPNITFKGHPTNIQDAFGKRLNNITAVTNTVYDKDGKASGTTIYRAQYIYDVNGFPVKIINRDGDTISYFYKKL